jgi:L-aminopeptidase/D-esterase-like protein
MDSLFRAVVEATEEAVIDAMVTGESMTGRDGNTAVGLPHDSLLELMHRYGRM